MNIEIPVKILSDGKGYLDRQCPNENCRFKFKVNLQDWEDKISDGEVHCPMCGCVYSSDNWNNEEQNNSIKEIAPEYVRAYLAGELDKLFNNFAHSTRNNKHFKITYKQNRPVTFENNPIGAKEEWKLDITCDKCGTRYSVIGSAYFCPCCGYYQASNVLDVYIDTVTKKIQSCDEIKTTLTDKYDIDAAENSCRSDIEDGLCILVSAFQKFAQCRFKEISSAEIRVNDFQSVDKGSKYFFDKTGSGYGAFLSSDELDRMKLYFQRRHILEHNAGIVDQRYIENSGDTDYSVGQRIVVREFEVMDFINIIKKLSAGLRTLTVSVK